jgi:HPt (histidine-containing phosphotransfer) domain-containing protein
MTVNLASLDADRGWIERRRYMRPEGTLGMRPVDRNFIRRFTQGNRNLEREVLYLFANQAPQYLANLAEATTAKAWHDAAHTLKGTARSIGAWRLARAAEAAERLHFDKEFDKRKFAIDTATEAINEVVGFIAEIYPEA